VKVVLDDGTVQEFRQNQFYTFPTNRFGRIVGVFTGLQPMPEYKHGFGVVLSAPVYSGYVTFDNGCHPLEVLEPVELTKEEQEDFWSRMLVP
jgi:hypothetical protein